MKILSCASFYGSGSSAALDLLSEYSEVKSTNNFEFRLLHDPDGISDLEFHLVQCHNRHNSGFALKRFLKLSKFYKEDPKNRYETCFNGKFYSLIEQFISRITDFKYRGWWFYDAYDGRGFFEYYSLMLFRKLLRMITKGSFDIFPSEVTYCPHPSAEKFLKETQFFIRELCQAANPEHYPYLVFDQVVPSQNISRILRYFPDEVFVFVVHRDPRDVFLCNKFFWKEHLMPVKSPVDFCKWYRYTLESGSPETLDLSHVKRIHFEDLIYRYDSLVQEIENFVGLKAANHTKKFTLFNPLRSVVNTRLWERYGTPEEISIIESELPEYLYDFDAIKANKVPGVPITNTDVF